ncbi:MAG: oligosaccharide repeat unit polymerase [Oscillospiraceae bacterium]|nr:oligosaccharide repeat unit polymerase [Oscillospiraceae bacterium]
MLSLVILIFFSICFLKTVRFTKYYLSDTIILLLFLVSFIPGTSLFAFINFPVKMIVLWVLYFLMLFMYNHITPHFTFNFPQALLKRTLTYLIIVYFSLVIIYIWTRFANFRIIYNILEVYDFRAETAEYDLPSILLYSFSISRVVLPSIMIYLLYFKKRFLAIWVIILMFMLFWIDGSKSVFFTIFISIAGYFFYSNKLNKLFAWALGLAAFIATIEFYLLNTFRISGIFIRRVLYLPNLLHFYYYDFFSENEFDYFRAGVLRRIGFNSPYSELGVPHTIGLEYFNNPATGANNGLFSDAYFNLGWLGMIIMPLMIVIAFRILESACRNINPKLLAAVIVTTVITFISTSFFTIMLSHGFIAICIIFYFLPRENNHKRIMNYVLNGR